MKFFLDEKGQHFTVFRLLIEAIMALAILVIIISTINYFEKTKIEVSKKRLFEGFSSAFETPNGDIVEKTDIAIEAGSIFPSAAFARYVRMQEECVSLKATPSSAISVPDSSTVKFEQSLTTSVFFQCRKQFDSFCETECIVSFAEPIR